MTTIPPEVLPCILLIAGMLFPFSPPLSYATAGMGVLYAVAMIVEYVRIGREARERQPFDP